MNAAGAPLRVALVHDWLTGMRGGERVLAALCRLYPDADLYTLVHARGRVSPAIERHRLRVSILGHLPRAERIYRHLLPLFPFAVEQFDLDDYDLVISSSHCAVKSVVCPGRARHLSYCHSPMRYGWDQFDAYFGARRIGASAHRASSGPSPTTLSGAPIAWQASMASSMRLYGTSAETTRKNRSGGPASGTKKSVSTGGYTTSALRL